MIESRHTKLPKMLIVTSMFLAILLFIPNIVMYRIVQIGPVKESLAIFFFPFVYSIADSLTEVYGKKNALYGINSSKQLLDIAQLQVEFNAIEADLSLASSSIPSHSQDLLLVQFINSFIPLDLLFEEAKKILKKNGYLSLITTTYESFPNAQKQLADFINSDHLLSPLVGHYYKSISQNNCVAANIGQLKQSINQQDMNIVSHQRLTFPINFNQVDELIRFGIEGTWFLNSLNLNLIPKSFLIKRLTTLFNKVFTLPYQDQQLIDVLLIKV